MCERLYLNVFRGSLLSYFYTCTIHAGIDFYTCTLLQYIGTIFFLHQKYALAIWPNKPNTAAVARGTVHVHFTAYFSGVNICQT